MDTTTARVPMLKQVGMDEYVYLLEKYEPAMYRSQLLRVKEKWQSGMTVKEIAVEEKRARVEIIVSLIHLADVGHILRPFDGRI